MDVDDDGDSDAVCIKGTSDSQLILLMNAQGTGTEWETDIAAITSGQAVNLNMGDINCDGLPDIVVTLWNNGGVVWYENPGDSTAWMEHTVSPYPDHPSALHCCDYDGDTDLDLVAGSEQQSGVRLFTNLDGQGTLWDEIVLPGSNTDCRDISSADIDGDGDLDLMGVLIDDEDIVWWENEASGSWDIHLVESILPGARTLAPADIDGDGDIDIAASGTIFPSIGWWENENGSGTSWIQHTVDESQCTKDLSASDADGDGDIDLLGCVEGSNEMVAIWEQCGDEWIRHCIFGGSDPLTCSFSDMDGDGIQDITAAWWGRIAWFEYTTYGFIGWMDSSILELLIPTDYECVHWGIIDWIATVPPGTSVMFQMREGNSPSDMGPWTDYITTPGTSLQGLLSGDAYLAQYRVTLVSTDPDTIPILEQMMVSYEPLGGVSSENSDQPGLYLAGSNPCHGLPVLRCVLNADALITLSIWDMAGRLVSQPAADMHILKGTHLMQTGELEPGIYFCRLETSEFSESLRLVILD
ncbi:MAG: T9SS type A sorting domain-containing protein [Candidatus Fermentibacteria bacterium]